MAIAPDMVMAITEVCIMATTGGMPMDMQEATVPVSITLTKIKERV
jgi:hypothetical protein